METAIVSNEAKLFEFSHETIDPRTRCPDHFRQHLLRYFGKHFFRLALNAILSEQQKSTRQSLLAGIEELIDQILFDPDVPRKHIRHEAVRECGFSVENANQLFFVNNK